MDPFWGFTLKQSLEFILHEYHDCPMNQKSWNAGTSSIRYFSPVSYETILSLYGPKSDVGFAIALFVMTGNAKYCPRIWGILISFGRRCNKIWYEILSDCNYLLGFILNFWTKFIKICHSGYDGPLLYRIH